MHDRSLILDEAGRLTKMANAYMDQVNILLDVLDRGDPDEIANVAYQIEQNLGSEAA